MLDRLEKERNRHIEAMTDKMQWHENVAQDQDIDGECVKIPKDILDKLNLKIGDKLKISVQNDSIVLSKI